MQVPYSVVVLIIWVIIGFTIYFDAKKRNIKAASSWGILGLLLGILGVVGYVFMIVIPNKRNV